MACGRAFRILATVLLALSAAACSRPGSYERFVTIAQSSGGVYEFELDLSDTTSTYDISFYTRTLGGGQTVAPSLPLMVAWESPEGVLALEEKVFMRAGGDRGRVEPYRSGVAMAEPGIWKISIRPAEVPEGFSGMGIICKRNDGARQTP